MAVNKKISKKRKIDWEPNSGYSATTLSSSKTLSSSSKTSSSSVSRDRRASVRGSFSFTSIQRQECDRLYMNLLKKNPSSVMHLLSRVDAMDDTTFQEAVKKL